MTHTLPDVAHNTAPRIGLTRKSYVRKKNRKKCDNFLFNKKIGKNHA